MSRDHAYALLFCLLVALWSIGVFDVDLEPRARCSTDTSCMLLGGDGGPAP